MAKEVLFHFTVSKAPFEDIGKDRVRLHWKRRLGKSRFVILELRNGNYRALVSALGHEESEDVIQMDIDLRSSLNVAPGDKPEIFISLASWWKQLRWYLKSTDPTVRIPAWLGIWSLALGSISILPVYSWVCKIVVFLSF